MIHFNFQGPPGWDPNLYWPWENCRMLLTFIPARMRGETLHPVLLMYHPTSTQLPVNNNMGFRPISLTRLKCWYCGNANVQKSCPSGERLVGCCVHCASAIFCAAVLPHNPALFKPTYKCTHLLDRQNILGSDRETASEVMHWKKWTHCNTVNMVNIAVLIA